MNIRARLEALERRLPEPDDLRPVMIFELRRDQAGELRAADLAAVDALGTGREIAAILAIEPRGVNDGDS